MLNKRHSVAAGAPAVTRVVFLALLFFSATLISGGGETGRLRLAAELITDCTGMPNGTPCDDGNPCTLTETCRSEVCVSAVSLTEAAGSPVAVGFLPSSVAAGDFNLDGTLDLAVANGGSNTVTILLGNGSGAFTQSVNSPLIVGSNPQSVAVGDFNLDGAPDLAVANFDADSVWILLGNGSGEFTTASSIDESPSPYSIAVGDFNQDGKPDLAVVRFTGSVSIFLGNGSGGFVETGYPMFVGYQPRFVTVGDFNIDDRADLAVANFGSNTVTILLGNGSGAFSHAAGSPIAVGPGPFSATVSDFNLDGKPDLAVPNYFSNTVTVLLGSGSGGFGEAAGSPITVGPSPSSAAVGDFNLDGKPDLAVANAYSSSATILLGNGSGGFSEAAGSPVGVGNYPISAAVADFNMDGKPDLATVNGASDSDSVTILLDASSIVVCPTTEPCLVGVCDPATGSCTTASAAGGAACSDGNPCTTNDGCHGSVCEGGIVTCTRLDRCHVAGTCDPAIGCSNPDAPPCPTPDQCHLAGTCDPEAGCLSPNAPDGTQCDDGNSCTVIDACRSGVCGLLFADAVGSPVRVGFAPLSLAVGDLNLDGTADLAVANRDTASVSILLGDGSGQFPQARDAVVGGYPYTVAIGDFNRDGAPDLALSNLGAPAHDVTILLGDGSGRFAQRSAVGASTYAYSLAVADFNLDGALDIVVTDTGLGTVTILLGNGSGDFSVAAGSPIAAGYAYSVAVGDFNLDRAPDLALATTQGIVKILLGDGFGGFTQAPGSPVSAGPGPYFVAVGDLNLDGKPDLAVADFGGTVAILLGNGSGGFAQPVGSPVRVGSAAYSVAIGDFNMDGKPDLAAANFGSDNVTILLGNGTGRFVEAVGSPIGVGVGPQFIAAGDFNVDGKPDLAVANERSNAASILLDVSSVLVCPTTDVCHVSVCDPSSGACTTAPAPVGSACNDASPCSTNDGCHEGACEGASVVCRAIDQCHLVGACDEATGNCSSPIAPDGTSCNDGNACTTDACENGFCVSTSVPDGTTCDDHDACTQSDACQNGSCLSGSPVVCVPIDPCHLAGTCDSRTGCSNPNAPDGTICDDGNACTLVDTCLTGACGSVAFVEAAGSPVGVGDYPYSVAVGDYNLDGTSDLAVANLDSNTVTILLGNGSGGFTEAAGSPVGDEYGPISIAVGDYNLDGAPDLAVANSSSGTVTILLGNGSGAFAEASGSPFSAGDYPYSVAVGDYNLDGKPDLAVANLGSNTVTILLGGGSGGFVEAVGSPVGVGYGPTSIAVGDYNLDDKTDLALANLYANNVTILLGDGSGRFTEASGSPVGVGDYPYSVAEGDYNLDGKPDLAVANFSSGTVTILLGNGSGGFAEASGSPVSAGDYPYSVAVGDYNLDGKPDLALANLYANNVTILRGDGAGSFTEPAGSPVGAGAYPISIAVGDYDLDGKPDLAVANLYSSSVTVLLDASSVMVCPASDACHVGLCDPGSGACTSAPAPVGAACDDGNACTTNDGCHAGACEGAAVVCRPLDQCHVAGTCDLATGACSNPNASDGASCDDGNQCTGTDTCQNGSCAGASIPDGTACDDSDACTRTDACQNGSCAGGNPIVCAPLDQCHVAGTCDIATGVCSNPDAPDDTVCDDGNACIPDDACHSGVCASRVSFTKAAGSPLGVGSGPVSVAVGDFNLDGSSDLAVANSSGSNNVRVLLGDGSGRFTIGSSVGVGGSPISVAVGDFNLDRAPDLAVANYGSRRMSILLGDGSGRFIEATGSPIGVGSGPFSVAVGDLNLDGKPDLAVPNVFSDNVTILLGDGSGGFIEATGSPVGVAYGPIFVAIADLNFDGAPDLAVANFYSSAATILLGDGSGGFIEAPSSPFSVGTYPRSVAVGDFNLDNKPDIAVANSGSGNVSILLGNGSGAFTEATGSPAVVAGSGPGPFSVGVGDVDFDGKPDLILANYYTDTATILLGNGTGGFYEAAGSPVGVGLRPWSITVGDLDLDGALDLAVPDRSANTVTVLMGKHNLAPDGASCSDSNACTKNDTCSSGSCAAGPLLTCDDSDPCTIDSCDAADGCHHAPDPSCNHTPDCGAAHSSQDELWPPDHTMVPVGIVGIDDADGDPVAVVVTGIAQDESVGKGSGATCPDGAGIGTDEALLRAERAGNGDGRVYTVSFTARDGRGGECTGTVTVCVPHDQDHHECGNQGPTADSAGSCGTRRLGKFPTGPLKGKK